MEIIWNKNPLRTKIMLNEHEKKEFWYKIKVEELQEIIMSASFHVDKEKHKDMFDLKQAVSELDPEYFCPEWTDGTKKGTKSKLDERVDQMFNYYISDLEHNPHCGDCTCFACSCSKCHAEHLLGVDTTKGLGKHEAHAIECAFRDASFKEEDDKTMDEAIAHLATYTPYANWEGAEAHFERWKAESNRAYEWLKTYRDLHFKS